jgi:hypothetical protein
MTAGDEHVRGEELIKMVNFASLNELRLYLIWIMSAAPLGDKPLHAALTRVRSEMEEMQKRRGDESHEK